MASGLVSRHVLLFHSSPVVAGTTRKEDPIRLDYIQLRVVSATTAMIQTQWSRLTGMINAEHEEILRTFRTCTDTEDGLCQRTQGGTRLHIDFIVQGAEKVDEKAPSLDPCTD